MKNNHISLFFLLFFFSILNFCNTSSKKKSNHSTINNEINNKFRKRDKINIFSKRKLENFESPVKKLEESSFVQLKIKIDEEELFRTCPYGDSYANNIYIAMQNARDTLQSSIKIEVDPSIVVRINSEDQNTIKKKYGIEKYSSFFNNNFHLIDNENFFIFGKFISGLTVDSTSYLLDEYGGSPCFGIIYFNENIDKSKLTDEYLTPLMLHHFIRLLGFNGEIILNPTLTKGYYPKVFAYAEKYFGCENIAESIVLSEENEGEYLFPEDQSSTELTGLYWPKNLFLGELLTKFEYSEEHVLSGFTWALLDDLSYLEVTKDYSEDLIRFGENKGCKFKCEFFTGGDYGDNVWDCTACVEGYFLAWTSSGTYCENNNNKGYYFLYNEESQIYKKCELEMPNCQTCSSQTQCTSCFKGYELEQENGKPTCKEEDNGLSAGAIVGIVIGCICFLAIIAIIIICILKKRNNEKEGGKEKIPENKNRENIEQNEKNTLENGIKVIEFSKNNEIMDSEANQKRMISEEKNIS